jgi:hypothetical protein
MNWISGVFASIVATIISSVVLKFLKLETEACHDEVPSQVISPRINTMQIKVPDYRRCEDGGIIAISDNARIQTSGSAPLAEGTRMFFRSNQEEQQFIRAAEHQGYSFESNR